MARERLERRVTPSESEAGGRQGAGIGTFGTALLGREMSDSIENVFAFTYDSLHASFLSPPTAQLRVVSRTAP